MSPQETVEAFIDAWNNMDMAAAFDLMSDDIIYHRYSMGTCQRQRGGAGGLWQFPPMEGADWETHAIAANGNTVLTERTVNFTLEGGKKASIRVMGTFELNSDGQISHWRDYFDSAEFERNFIDQG